MPEEITEEEAIEEAAAGQEPTETVGEQEAAPTMMESQDEAAIVLGHAPADCLEVRDCEEARLHSELSAAMRGRRTVWDGGRWWLPGVTQRLHAHRAHLNAMERRDDQDPEPADAARPRPILSASACPGQCASSSHCTSHTD